MCQHIQWTYCENKRKSVRWARVSRARMMPEGQLREVCTTKTHVYIPPTPYPSRPGTITAELVSSPRSHAPTLTNSVNYSSTGSTGNIGNNATHQTRYAVTKNPKYVKNEQLCLCTMLRRAVTHLEINRRPGPTPTTVEQGVVWQ